MADVWKGLPKTVRVMGKRYKMRVVDKVDDEDSDGECDSSVQVCLLKRNVGFEPAIDTAWHEACHAVEQQLNLEMDHQMFQQFVVGILALMRDNPSFVKFVMAREPKEPKEVLPVDPLK